MSEPKRPRYQTDFTQKIRLCRGCHNELPADVDICPICRTPIGSPGTEDEPPLSPDPPAMPPPIPRRDPDKE